MKATEISYYKPFAENATSITTEQLRTAFRVSTGKEIKREDIRGIKLHYTVNGKPVSVPMKKHLVRFAYGDLRTVLMADDGTPIDNLYIDDVNEIRITYKDHQGTHSVRLKENLSSAKVVEIAE